MAISASMIAPIYDLRPVGVVSNSENSKKIEMRLLCKRE